MTIKSVVITDLREVGPFARSPSSATLSFLSIWRSRSQMFHQTKSSNIQGKLSLSQTLNHTLNLFHRSIGHTDDILIHSFLDKLNDIILTIPSVAAVQRQMASVASKIPGIALVHTGDPDQLRMAVRLSRVRRALFEPEAAIGTLCMKYKSTGTVVNEQSPVFVPSALWIDCNVEIDPF